MGKRMAKRSDPSKARALRRYRKVTYSLPEHIAREMDARHAGSEQGKSRLVAEALAFYFADQDRRALAALYAQAAEDPEFQADNEAVQRDFAALDREADTQIQ